MAEFFVREGITAVAVHAGENSAPRATSLERLRDGELQVIFAVDMFNEGVDVPSLDTVLMLRPTESIIIWLQQLGRGLRVSADKQRLTVIDYIGNHRVFLTKLSGIAAIADRDAESSGRRREILAAIRNHRITLPVGCEVTYESEAINILEARLRRPRTEEFMYIFIAISRSEMESVRGQSKFTMPGLICAAIVNDPGLDLSSVWVGSRAQSGSYGLPSGTSSAISRRPRRRGVTNSSCCLQCLTVAKN